MPAATITTRNALLWRDSAYWGRKVAMDVEPRDDDAFTSDASGVETAKGREKLRRSHLIT